jgi:hypothetical protein
MIRVLLALLLLLAPAFVEPAEAKRVALIIANSKYTSATSLKNPAADAQLVAASLRKTGFTSVDVRIDLGKAAMERELSLFGQKAEGADVAIVYYAGHGIEAGGQNYLIPTDARLLRDRDLEVEATRLDTAMLMTEAAKMRIVVLDACRNNPFIASMQRTMRNRAVGRGLAAVEPEGETLVVYAAKAGATASDGEGANSPFAESLAKRLVEPGLEISLLFRAVRDDVLDATGRAQEPFTYGSLSGKAFYFVPSKGGSIAPVTANQNLQPPVVSAQTSEALFWQGTMNANTESSYRDYLKRYPKGEYASVAKENLQRFAKPVAVQQQTPVAPSGPSAVVGGLSFGSLVQAFSKANTAQSASVGGASARDFAFTPSAQLRRDTRAAFVSNLGAADPITKALLDTVMPPNAPFSLVEKEFANQYGMSVNNLADSMAVLLETFRSVSKMDESDATKVQAAALRNQIAGFLSNDSSITSLSPQQKQSASDSALMLAIFVQAGYELAKQTGGTQKSQYANTVAAQAQQMLGFDVRRLRLTNNGFEL